MAENHIMTAYRHHLRERIVDTAIRAFATRGIRAVKMDDIAHELAISKRTLYEIYDNKEDLLCAGVKKYQALKEQQWLERMAQGGNVIDLVLQAYRSEVEDFKQTTPQFYVDLERYPRVMAMFEDSQKHNRKHLLQFLERGVEEGYFRENIDYDIVILLFDAIGRQVRERQLYMQYSIEQLFFNLVFISIRGLCTPLGAEMLDQRLKAEQG